MERITLVVPPEAAGRRLDAFLAQARPETSRTRWQELLEAGCIRVNGHPAKQRLAVIPGAQVVCDLPSARPVTVAAQDIPLTILFEDADIIVIDKPAGLVVHPAPGHADGTLVNALLHHCHDLAGIGGELRPGIVHRLDKDTSGVMVVAKSERAMAGLVRQFKAGTLEKEYLAIVRGHPSPAAGKIDTLIGRHPMERKKMSARPAHGRPALSEYRTEKVLPGAALVRVRIHTGRTHQIRVHLAHIGHAVLGDAVYGARRREDAPVPRQMLHAARLTLEHPGTGERLTFLAPLPADMAACLQTLETCRPAACPCALEKGPHWQHRS